MISAGYRLYHEGVIWPRDPACEADSDIPGEGITQGGGTHGRGGATRMRLSLPVSLIDLDRDEEVVRERASLTQAFNKSSQPPPGLTGIWSVNLNSAVF